MKRLTLMLRLVLAATFLGFGGLKLYGLRTGHADTVQSMFNLYLGTHGPWRYLASASEIVLGLWLLSGLRLRAAATSALVVLVLFSALIGWELLKDDPVPCGCGATLAGPPPALPTQISQVWPPPPRDVAPIRRDLALGLARNLALLIATAMILDRQRRARRKHADQERAIGR
jgi:hypothetical protein